MIHLHVRDADARHTLDAQIYDQVATRVEQVTGGQMLIQLTSEAAGRYKAEEQMRSAEDAQPRFLSMALREIFPPQITYDGIKSRIHRMNALKTSRQIILYSSAELERFESLCDDGLFEDRSHVLLFVAGSYSGAAARPDAIDQFLGVMRRPHRWMACAFGPQEQNVLRAAAAAGGHVRTGFENNLYRANGCLAESNAQLVAELADVIMADGRHLASYQDALNIMSDERET